MTATATSFRSEDFLALADRLHGSLDYAYLPAGYSDTCVALYGEFSHSWFRCVAETLLGAERGAQLVSEAVMAFIGTGIVVYWPVSRSMSLFAIPGDTP